MVYLMNGFIDFSLMFYSIDWLVNLVLKSYFIYKLAPMEGMQKINEDFYVDKSKSLGKGNFGTVYKGYHLSENRIIAVKFI